MLRTTIAIASAKATTSSRVTGPPKTTAAGANSGCSAAISASIIIIVAAGGGVRGASSSTLGRDLHQDLVGLDHAELEARLLLDHLQPFLQVAHLGFEPLVARARRIVLGLLRLQLRLELALVGQAALAEPEFGIHEREQR